MWEDGTVLSDEIWDWKPNIKDISQVVGRLDVSLINLMIPIR